MNAHALQGMADLFVSEPELATHLTFAGEHGERIRAFLAPAPIHEWDVRKRELRPL